ncbi:MAG TPA: hypothetical protein P5539_15510, partial [Mesotoga sp.]|nr:hypothetical protein [Mesotoga sp.]
GWVEVARPTHLFRRERAGTAVIDSITKEDFESFLSDWEKQEFQEQIIFTEGHPPEDTDDGRIKIGHASAFQLREVDGVLGLWAKPANTKGDFGDTSFSIVYERNKLGRTDGKSSRFWISRIGVTDAPVIQNLRNFFGKGTMSLSAAIYDKMAMADSVLTEEPKMKNIALALGLPEDATEPQILEAVKNLKATAATPPEDTLKVALSTRGIASLDDLLSKDAANDQAVTALINQRKALIAGAGLEESEFTNALDADYVKIELSKGKFDLFTGEALLSKIQPPKFKSGDQDPDLKVEPNATDSVKNKFRK